MSKRPDFWTATQGKVSSGSHIFTKDSPDIALCGYALDDKIEVVPIGLKVHADCDTCNRILADDLVNKMMDDLQSLGLANDEDD